MCLVDGFLWVDGEFKRFRVPMCDKCLVVNWEHNNINYIEGISGVKDINIFKIENNHMQGEQHKGEPSLSTQYRFGLQDRVSQLGQFLDFKREHEGVLSGERISALKRVYVHGIVGRNSKQQLVVVDRIGGIKVTELWKVVDDEEFAGYLYQRMLYISECVLKEKEQVVWVIDLAGKIMQLASKRTYGLLEKVVPMLQRYFPGMLAKIYFVNTPMLFDTIWNRICEYVEAQTGEKVIFLNDDLEELYLDADPTILPEFLGGELSDEILQGEEQEKKMMMKGFKKQEESEEEQEAIDFSSLKQALSGLKVKGSTGLSVAQTPLNTEADDIK